MILKIFKDGYLDVKYLNPNYRGIVGFPADWWMGLYVEPDHWIDTSILTTKNGTHVSNGYHTISMWYDDFCRVRIPQFHIDDIPIGELVWIERPHFAQSKRSLTSFYLEVLGEYINPKYRIVPYLIAGTEEDAEKLKDWNIS